MTYKQRLGFWLCDWVGLAQHFVSIVTFCYVNPAWYNRVVMWKIEQPWFN